jgi:hypothetical protein
MGACCKPACPSDESNAGKPDGCGLSVRTGGLRRRLLRADLPEQWNLRRL